MHRRIAARLVTGPAAFLLGAVIDLLTFAVTSLRARGRALRILYSRILRSADRGPGPDS